MICIVGGPRHASLWHLNLPHLLQQLVKVLGMEIKLAKHALDGIVLLAGHPGGLEARLPGGREIPRVRRDEPALAAAAPGLADDLGGVLVHAHVGLGDLELVAAQQVLLVERYVRAAVVAQARLQAAVGNAVDVEAVRAQAVKARLEARARVHGAKGAHHGVELRGRRADVDVEDEQGARQRVPQDRGDRGVGVGERGVGEVALRGVEPGEEEGLCVDLSRGELRAKGGGDGVDGGSEAEASADDVEADGHVVGRASGLCVWCSCLYRSEDSARYVNHIFLGWISRML